MVKLICLSALLFISNLTEAQYQIVDSESFVKFSIKNFGISTGGSFSGIRGKITFDINQLNTALFEVSIDAKRVNTGNESRDNHLRNEDYFDVKKYPRIYFVSYKVAPSTQKGTFIIFGKLTIKNQSKEISFPFTVSTKGDVALFKGNFNINRKDFNIGGTSAISDNLEVQLSIQTQLDSFKNP
jgi:polyisoprenoid-binding protein YceI